MGLFKPDIEKLKKNKDITGLEKALGNKDPVIRRKAIEAIGEIDNREAIDILAKYTKIKDDSSRSTLIFTLILKASDARAGELFEYIKSKAEESLIDMGPEAVESLINLYVRGYGNKEVIKKILSEECRSEIGYIINSIKSRVSYFDSYPDEFESWHYPNVGHKNRLKELSVELIVDSERSAIKPLCHLLQDGNRNIRSWAALMLSKIECEEALDYLIDTLGDEDKKVRLSIFNALSKIKSDKSAEALVGAFRNEKDRDMRNSLIVNIKNIGKSAIKPLAKALKDEDKEVRLNAAWTLCEMEGKEEVAEEIISALGDDNWEVRDYIAKALGEVKGVNAEKALVAAINDSDSRVRISIIYSLGKIGSLEARKALVKLLEDGDMFVRYRAAFTLGKLGEPVAIDEIMKHLFEIPEASFSESLKEVNDILTALIPKSSLTEDIIYYSISVSTYGNYLWTESSFNRYRPSPILEPSDSALEKLCNIKSPVVSNLLHLIADKKDIEVTVTSDCANEDWSRTYKLDFNNQCLKAREELKRRGNPPYDAALYLK
jgi:HEAT repeat protein